jgi:hypothetical protein
VDTFVLNGTEVAERRVQQADVVPALLCTRRQRLEGRASYGHVRHCGRTLCPRTPPQHQSPTELRAPADNCRPGRLTRRPVLDGDPHPNSSHWTPIVGGRRPAVTLAEWGSPRKVGGMLRPALDEGSHRIPNTECAGTAFHQVLQERIAPATCVTECDTGAEKGYDHGLWRTAVERRRRLPV